LCRLGTREWPSAAVAVRVAVAETAAILQQLARGWPAQH
jgi:hypothetical protein